MRDMIKAMFSWKMIIQLFLGLYSGLPLLLIGGTLQAWMREGGVNLTTIGIFAAVGLPYSLKMLWAPFLDRFVPPFLDRRRGWLVIFQIFLGCSLLFMAVINPRIQTWLMAFGALLVAFFSASQDIVIDAYRREVLDDNELGLGSSLYVNGYRIGMLLAGTIALMMAESMSWNTVYTIMAVVAFSGVVFTTLAPSLKGKIDHPESIKDAVILPFVDFFKKDGAWLFLAFILLYKVGDSMAAHMSMPLYLDKGYSKLEIGAIAKGAGMAATIAGAFLGGAAMLRLGINLSLWIFGGLQMVSTAGFMLLANMEYSQLLLTGVIGFENLASGMGTSAFVAFMASITNKKFTATQYALLTSFMAVPRTIITMPTGKMVEVMGYSSFFLFCTLIAIPGMFLLSRFAPLKSSRST